MGKPGMAVRDAHHTHPVAGSVRSATLWRRAGQAPAALLPLTHSPSLQPILGVSRNASACQTRRSSRWPEKAASLFRRADGLLP